MIAPRRLAAPLLLVSLVAGCGSTDSAAGDGDPGPPAVDANGCPTATADLGMDDGDAAAALPPHTPRWAFRPWISKDISTADDTRAFVKGFADRDIPVGVVVLDSPWETNYNSFVPNPSRYPGFDGLLSELHGQDIRMVLWITQMMNSHSFDLEMGGDVYPGPAPDYDLGATCGFYVDDAASYGWWKGSGAGVDFLNPRALAWHHGLQDRALDLGFDGWKLDFGDSYVRTDPVSTAAGDVPHQRYSEAYYHDFLAHGRARRGDDFLTMARAWDESYEFAGRFFAKKQDAPVAWMGDNRRDWVGVADALREMFVSATAGYVALGSDVGGYLDHDDKNLTGPVIPFDTDVFARWVAVGALSPLMQLHGRANIAPWTVPDHVDETVALYRYWAKLHDALVPFYFSLAEEAASGGPGIVRPVVGAPPQWEGDFRYLLGDALLVVPVLDASGARAVGFPDDARFLDWWDLGADPIAPGSHLAAWDATDRAKIPLYLREGAIVPLEIVDDANALGTSASKGALTVLAWPGSGTTGFQVHDDAGAFRVAATGSSGVPAGADVSLSAVPRDVVLAIRAEFAPKGVTVGAVAQSIPWAADRAAFDATSGAAAYWEPSRKLAWVRVPKGATTETHVTLTP